MTKRELLKVYAEVAELDGPRGGYICKRRDGRWVIVGADGREVTA